MKRISYFLLIVAIVATACKNNKNKNLNSIQQSTPISVDTTNFTAIQWIDSIVDFGTINYGEKIQIKFRCKNTGNKDLIILSARPGCGCTVADYTKEPIKPGNEGLITASFDSKKSHSNDVNKSLTVTTNTKNGTEHYLFFKGTIKGGESNDKIMVPHLIKPETIK